MKRIILFAVLAIIVTSPVFAQKKRNVSTSDVQTCFLGAEFGTSQSQAYSAVFDATGSTLTEYNGCFVVKHAYIGGVTWNSARFNCPKKVFTSLVLRRGAEQSEWLADVKEKVETALNAKYPMQDDGKGNLVYTDHEGNTVKYTPSEKSIELRYISYMEAEKVKEEMAEF